jgi:hypothetical protein
VGHWPLYETRLGNGRRNVQRGECQFEHLDRVSVQGSPAGVPDSQGMPGGVFCQRGVRLQSLDISQRVIRV